MILELNELKATRRQDEGRWCAERQENRRLQDEAKVREAALEESNFAARRDAAELRSRSEALAQALAAEKMQVSVQIHQAQQYEQKRRQLQGEEDALARKMLDFPVHQRRSQPRHSMHNGNDDWKPSIEHGSLPPLQHSSSDSRIQRHYFPYYRNERRSMANMTKLLP